MTYRGHVKGGVVVIDSPTPLPEGMVVEITPVDILLDVEGKPVHPAFLKVGDHAIDMGVSDLGSNIDHYLYGHPRVEDGE